MKKLFTQNSFSQLIKYGLVGVSNTLLTIAIIWILTHWLHFSEYTANITGYAAGIINSFIWNRNWTFGSKGKVSTALLRFMVIFALTYLLQFGVLYLLLNYTSIDAFLGQLLAMCVYTATNFPLNKYYTFNK